ncbi:T-complex protein 1 subunit [Theileria orientalis strain Shintoku]|uniref:CCT-eta n=1 Tax=Theileria orientalis strain Shintoku TaxID=869250 RepID=J4CDM0_THEOR|nr:T-complex protein 1 subunit [Theileria orientalis strain Shintoku]PVC50904.1 T-complex protein 1 subunit [Theileria orientalis]BAM41377.1 T-complex protein 1 subunit [Theileria orientalis strain Shintoku]|eukprot:XP_009691678.1 T-complex protein 1 subunit [Theileria orientalis strain Shintoku]
MSHLMNLPILLLKEGTDTSQGQAQIVSNINACQAIVDCVKTTLGPRGMDKLIHTERDVTITNDGATVLKLLDVTHPAASVLVEIAKSQDEEVGDGTTSVTILAGELLNEAKKFVLDGINPQVIIKYYREACNVILDLLDKVSINLSEKSAEERKELLIKCAETTLNSKLLSGYKRFFAEMVVEAVGLLGEDLDDSLIGIKKVTGGSCEDSKLIRGVAFKKTFTYAGAEQQPKKFVNPKILLLNLELELKSEKENAEVVVNNPQDYQSIIDAEYRIIFEKLENAVKLGANVVLSKLPIGDIATQYFAGTTTTVISNIGISTDSIIDTAIDTTRIITTTTTITTNTAITTNTVSTISTTITNISTTSTNISTTSTNIKKGIFCNGRVEEADLIRTSKATGASIQTTLNNLSTEVLGRLLKTNMVTRSGRCDTFEEVQVGGERYNVFTGSTGTCTIILRGGAQQFIEESERSLNDALMIVKRATKSNSVLPGAGSTEMLLSTYLYDYSLHSIAPNVLSSKLNGVTSGVASGVTNGVTSESVNGVNTGDSATATTTANNSSNSNITMNNTDTVSNTTVTKNATTEALDKKSGIAGKKHLIVNGFARALESIPRNLAANSGYNPNDILTQLRSEYNKLSLYNTLSRGDTEVSGALTAGSWFGVDCRNGKVCNPYKECIWEPSLVKKNSIYSATEAACLILSIDETVKHQPRQQPTQ